MNTDKKNKNKHFQSETEILPKVVGCSANRQFWEDATNGIGGT
jgi:hypothetical protein